MNREKLEKWLVDLETTEEPQTREVLTRVVEDYGLPAGDCCLGRLCKVAIADGVAIQTTYAYGAVDYAGYTAQVPNRVCDWLEHSDDAFFEECALRNDNDMHSFKEIAAWIRKEYT